jgi:hypothetical protein
VPKDDPLREWLRGLRSFFDLPLQGLRPEPNERWVISLSHYHFDLDQRVCSIKDHDILLPGTEVSLSAPLTAKRISPDHRHCHCQLCRYPGHAKRLRDALDNAEEYTPMDVVLETYGGEVRIHPKRELTFDRSRPTFLRLTYSLPLGADTGAEPLSEQLLYCGAVQPLDYLGARKELGITHAYKAMILSVRWREPFLAWWYDAADPRPFPAHEQSTERDSPEGRRHEWFVTLKAEQVELARARYFGLFVATVAQNSVFVPADR